MAKKKAGGTVTQHKGRRGKRLGVKISGGQTVKTGQIIIRQLSTKFHAGSGVGEGRNHTLFSLKDGKVRFATRLGKKYVTVI